jgi:aspartate-semialdehyde dehydrogenase
MIVVSDNAIVKKSKGRRDIMRTYSVGILGATGVVGQRYIDMLRGHPWFKVSFVAASQSSSGKTYGEAVEGRWQCARNIPDDIAAMTVYNLDDIAYAVDKCDFIFSALGGDVARIYEEKYAEAGFPVVSNASAHRYDDDVPVIIPEINAHHLHIIPVQQRKRGWSKGYIVTKPNCSLQSYMLPLYILHREYVVKKVSVVTMQAVSGAGTSGPSLGDLADNIIPYISGEERKSEIEPCKILGRVTDEGIVASSEVLFSASCNRVPVLDGHMACVSVECERKGCCDDVKALWRHYSSEREVSSLPSAPDFPLFYCDEEDRPQPQLDRERGGGMTVSVGRLRPCSVMDYSFVALSHNTIRGAAGGAILTAELLAKKGLFYP